MANKINFKEGFLERVKSMKCFLKTHNHTITTILVVSLGCMLDFGMYALIGVLGFYAGREHSQAEYRYMKLKGINRSKLGFFDGFKLEAWDKDSFLNDLMIPILVGLLTIWMQILFGLVKI